VAGVSAPLKLMKEVSREVVVQRLQAAADALADALARDDDEAAVQSALYRVFRNYIDAPSTDVLAAAAAVLRPQKAITTAALGLAGPALAIPAARAFGGPRPA
jgi:hypothetical protein